MQARHHVAIAAYAEAEAATLSQIRQPDPLPGAVPAFSVTIGGAFRNDRTGVPNGPPLAYALSPRATREPL